MGQLVSHTHTHTHIQLPVTEQSNGKQEPVPYQVKSSIFEEFRCKSL